LRDLGAARLPLAQQQEQARKFACSQALSGGGQKARWASARARARSRPARSPAKTSATTRRLVSESTGHRVASVAAGRGAGHGARDRPVADRAAWGRPCARENQRDRAD